MGVFPFINSVDQGKTILEKTLDEVEFEAYEVEVLKQEDFDDDDEFYPDDIWEPDPEPEGLLKISFLPDTVHFKRRKLDKKYEIIAKSEQEGFGWVCLAVAGTHDEAITAIKKFRRV